MRVFAYIDLIHRRSKKKKKKGEEEEGGEREGESIERLLVS